MEAHALLWDSWAYRARISDCRFEEIRSVIATTQGNSDVMLKFPYEVVNDSQYGMRTDGTPWRPRVWMADRPRGSTTAPAEIQAPTIALSNPDAETAGRAVLLHFVNDTGITLNNGDVASIKSSDLGKLGASSGSSTQQHVVVWNSAVTSWAAGERCTAAIAGVVQVRINAACAVGDLIVPAINQQASVVASGTATVKDLHRALGTALQSASAGALVWVKLR